MSSVCAVCESAPFTGLIQCTGGCLRTFHADCVNLNDDSISFWRCSDCTYGIHRCFKCKDYELDDNLQQCSRPNCGRYFHKGGVDDCGASSDTSSFNSTTATCARHACAGTPCKMKFLASLQPTVSCIRCSKAYHAKCVPANVRSLTDTAIICFEHPEEEDLPPPRPHIKEHVKRQKEAPPKPFTAVGASDQADTKEEFVPGSSDEVQAAIVYLTHEELLQLFEGRLPVYDTMNRPSGDIAGVEHQTATDTNDTPLAIASMSGQTSAGAEPDVELHSVEFRIQTVLSSDLVHAPEMFIKDALYPRFRCKVCGIRYEQKPQLAAHVSEHTKLAALLKESKAPTLEQMQRQWFHQPRFLMQQVAGLGAVQNASADSRVFTGKFSRTWYPST